MGVLSGFFGGGTGGSSSERFRSTVVGQLAGGESPRRQSRLERFDKQKAQFLFDANPGRVIRRSNERPGFGNPLFGTRSEQFNRERELQSEVIQRAAVNQTLLGQIFGSQTGASPTRQPRRAPSLLGQPF